jgi:stage II sporulation protein P
VNGVSTAKVMIVCGTDAMGLEHPYWRENFKLASKIQNAAQIMYPGMMRPINLRRERFNMHTTKGSLLFEIGSNGNTLDQAIEGGRNTAEAVAAVLLDR